MVLEADDAGAKPAPGYHPPVTTTSSQTLTFAVELPKEALRHHPWDPERVVRDMRLFWLIEQVRQRRLASGKAAEMAGLSRAAFEIEMGRHRVSAFDFDPDELAAELRPIR